MNKKMMMFTVCFALITVSGAFAQGRTLELSLTQALEIALSDNPTIKVANLEIERYKYVRREAIGNHLPQVSVNSQYSYSAVKQTMSKKNGISLGADNTINTAASITIPLFAPAVYSTLKMTRTQQEMAVESARRLPPDADKRNQESLL
ncbi:MAG: TolC family protein [Alistipes putredinis]|nr:MAG: TolC family protein [Alistipes putredinis]